MTHDISDDELERRMRQKLLADSTPKPASPLASMSDAERRLAENWLGRDNIERLERRKGEGRFRPSPVSVHYEYWHAAGDHLMPSTYVIARIENGRQISHWQGMSEQDMEHEKAALRAKGYRVRRYILADEPGEKELRKAAPSGRQDALNKLASFNVRGR
jgi:hypothetical protein